MYRDDDLWPVTCPRCGEHFHKQVGWLKKNNIMRCPSSECGANLWYYPETFIRDLNKAQGAVNDFSRDLRSNEKDA